jgi:DNA repair exonuclease SbcCD ATPase subunit
VWIERVEVVNVGPFADFKADLTRGSVGVFGKNGSGKSTLLNLVYGAVTNDFSRFDGVKTDCVRTTADPKAPSSVTVVVRKGDKTLKVIRKFRGAPGTTLAVAGGETITDANKAQQAIDDALGVDRKMLDLYVFKTQDKIYDFLSTTPAERAKAYQTLCRTERASRRGPCWGSSSTRTAT